MADPPHLNWRRPRQARSRASLHRMLEAAEQLLLDRHFHDLSVQEVVAQAGSSVGAFYRRFGDKLGLMAALEEQYREERASTLESFTEVRWTGTGLRERVRAFVDFNVRANRERTGLFRAMWLRAWGAPPAQAPERPGYTKAVGTYTSFLLACRDEIGHPDPELAVRLGVMAVILVANQLTLFAYTRAAQTIDIDTDEQLVEELTRLLTGYLLA